MKWPGIIVAGAGYGILERAVRAILNRHDRTFPGMWQPPGVLLLHTTLGEMKAGR